MGTGGDYDHGFRTEVPVPSGLYRRFMRFAWDREGGVVTRCMAAFEVETDEKIYQVVRFDTAHGCFHQHHPDFPEPSDERTLLGHIEKKDQLAYAKAEMLRNYKKWETIVLENVVLEIEESNEKGD